MKNTAIVLKGTKDRAEMVLCTEDIVWLKAMFNNFLWPLLLKSSTPGSNEPKPVTVEVHAWRGPHQDAWWRIAAVVYWARITQKCIAYGEPVRGGVCAPVSLSVCWHFEQQGRHVVCIKDVQTDGCREKEKKKEKTQYIVAYSYEKDFQVRLANSRYLHTRGPLNSIFWSLLTHKYYLRAFQRRMWS